MSKRRSKGLAILGLLLLVGGVLALVYGGFSYAKESHDAKLGPIEIELSEKERVDIPQWLAVTAAVVGGCLLYLGGRR